MHVAHMSENTAETWVCDVCGHYWLKGENKPTHCASSKCRSRKWNAGTGKRSLQVEREVMLHREEGSDAYTVEFLSGDDVQGVLEYAHQGRWPQMQDDIDAWRKNGIVPAEAAL